MSNTMIGRHATGGKLASPGKIKKGGSEPASNKFTTNANAETSKKKPFVPNAKDTSAHEQIMIKEAPSPFKNKMQTPQMPVSSTPRGAVPGQEPKNIYAGKSGNSAPKYPSGAAVGYSKLPNQSGQIGGRTSVASSSRKAGNNLSRFPTKRGNAFYGDN